MKSSIALDFEQGPWSAPQAKPVQHTDCSRESSAEQCCPLCKQEVATGNYSVDRVVTRSLHQLLFGVVLLLAGVIRFIRLAVAWALSIVGLIGFACSQVALRIAHPDDRRFLPIRRKPPTTR